MKKIYRSKKRNTTAASAQEELAVGMAEEKVSIQEEIPKIKGLFASGKIKKAEARLAEIEDELAKLERVETK